MLKHDGLQDTCTVLVPQHTTEKFTRQQHDVTEVQRTFITMRHQSVSHLGGGLLVRGQKLVTVPAFATATTACTRRTGAAANVERTREPARATSPK
jgi:hypothetical protein